MTQSDLKQRLTAILAADAAGYSRLMAGDERATVASLDAARAVFRRHIESNQGRVIDMAGDSVLAMFETATGAVSAALAVQQELKTRFSDVPEDRRMRFRIGVHLGDVIEKADGTIYGDGVNIAARLEGLAEPSGVTVSDAVRGAVKGKVSAAFEDRGEQKVKNIAEPVRAYRVKVGGDASKSSPTVGEIDLSLPDRPSIAVLPFTNMSGDQENEYFADGLTEELLNLLANIRGLRVASRTSAFFFKGKRLDIATIANKLNVATILEGSVRKHGRRVRITAQLIEVMTDSHLWSRTYDRELEDVFAVQDDIAQAVVAELKSTLVGEDIKAAAAEVQAAALGRTDNAEAHEYFLQARFLMNRWTSEANLKAKELLERAVELDPRFAMAWSELSVMLFALTVHGVISAPDGYERSAAAARSALDVEPGLAEGYVGLARVLAVEWKWSEVSHALERARELAPNNPRVLRSLGRHVANLGRHEEGIEYLRQARLLDPLSPVSHFNLGGRLLFAGRFHEALAAYKHAFDLNPDGGLVHAGLALTYLCMGQPARALEMIAAELNPLAKLSIRAMAEHSLGHRERSDEALSALVAGHRDYAPYQIAVTYAWRGENKSALEWLEDACTKRDSSLENVATEPFLVGLRAEPRYRELVRKVGLPLHQ